MESLGSIFDGVEEGAPQKRGPDLRWEVQVPRSALGARHGVSVHVPRQIPHPGGVATRATSERDDADRIRLHLPENLRDGSVLKLRQQGGQRPDGAPGDLYLESRVVERPRRWPYWVAFTLFFVLALLLLLRAS